MVAGTIRLSAFGNEDKYLSYRPQITFFKHVYKRLTFFAKECIDQSFNSTPNFGGKYSCILAAHGDVLLDVLLRVRLPSIPVLPSSLKVRWVDFVACALVKKVEFEISGSVIDTLSGEWIRIWMELTGHRKHCERRGSHLRGLRHMCGGTEDGNSPHFESSQESQLLFLPIPFWFTKSSGQCFPIAAVNTREVRINVEFNPLSTLLQYGPTLYIQIAENQVFFSEGDLLLQGSQNDLDRRTDASAMAVFCNFDADTGRLYFNPVFGSFSFENQDSTQRLLAPARYQISNAAGYFVTPKAAPVDLGIDLTWFLTQRFSLGETVIMAEYAFLSPAEKAFFDRRRHEYVIEQLQVYSLTNLGRKNNVQLVVRRSCLELIWVVQISSSSTNCGLPFNYTDLPDGTGIPLIQSQEVLLNTESLFADPAGNFFRDLQLLYHHAPCADRLPGLQIHSFALSPDIPQPSGSINMSRIEKAYLKFQLSSFPKDAMTMRVFARTYNVLVVHDGVAEVIF